MEYIFVKDGEDLAVVDLPFRPIAGDTIIDDENGVLYTISSHDGLTCDVKTGKVRINVNRFNLCSKSEW